MVDTALTYMMSHNFSILSFAKPFTDAVGQEFYVILTFVIGMIIYIKTEDEATAGISSLLLMLVLPIPAAFKEIVSLILALVVAGMLFRVGAK